MLTVSDIGMCWSAKMIFFRKKIKKYFVMSKKIYNFED